MEGSRRHQKGSEGVWPPPCLQLGLWKAVESFGGRSWKGSVEGREVGGRSWKATEGRCKAMAAEGQSKPWRSWKAEEGHGRFDALRRHVRRARRERALMREGPGEGGLRRDEKG